MLKFGQQYLRFAYWCIYMFHCPCQKMCNRNLWQLLANPTKLQLSSMQFISLSIDPLQGVNHKDEENSHRVHQNIQSSSIESDTV